MLKPKILMLENDSDDRYITQVYFDEHGVEADLQFETDTERFFDSLEAEAKPTLILISMVVGPLGAKGLLQQLKSDKETRYIPVVVLSGSRNEKQIRECYDAGANTVIVKPADLSGTESKILNFVKYWFETAELSIV